MSETEAISKSTSTATIPKNWDEKDDGKVCMKNVHPFATPLWRDGWYKNPSSGRSNNYGIDTTDPQRHRTVIIKGGSFFVDRKFEEAFVAESLVLDDVYGGISFDAAQKEMRIAKTIQEKFTSLLHKKANCPDPLDVQVITSIIDNNGEVVSLLDYFHNRLTTEPSRSFIMRNIMKTAQKVGIDVLYPTREHADPRIKENPYRWILNACLEKTTQSVYRYIIDGPNTRLLDLMTQELSERRKYFIEANAASSIQHAVEVFCSQLGTFYGVLHKHRIGYHEISSDHCTLVDITVSGVIMDIGGLSIDTTNQDGYREGYLVSIWKTTNLIAYLCKHILKTNDDMVVHGLRAFWSAYKNFYSDENVIFFSEEISDTTPQDIRTKYFDTTSGTWIKLASDLDPFVLLHSQTPL